MKPISPEAKAVLDSFNDAEFVATWLESFVTQLREKKSRLVSFEINVDPFQREPRVMTVTVTMDPAKGSQSAPSR